MVPLPLIYLDARQKVAAQPLTERLKSCPKPKKGEESGLNLTQRIESHL
jgi:hypothetical protein